MWFVLLFVCLCKWISLVLLLCLSWFGAVVFVLCVRDRGAVVVLCVCLFRDCVHKLGLVWFALLLVWSVCCRMRVLLVGCLLCGCFFMWLRLLCWLVWCAFVVVF